MNTMNQYVQTEFQGIQSEIEANNLLPEDKLTNFILDLINKPITSYNKLEKLREAHQVLQRTHNKLVLLGTYTAHSPSNMSGREVYLLPAEHHPLNKDTYYIIRESGIPTLMGSYEWIPDHIQR